MKTSNATMGNGLRATEGGRPYDGNFAYTVYVSLTGNKNATGTINDPFNSITAARNFLAGKTSAENRGIIYIREGTYYVDSNEPTIMVGKDNSYTTFAAYNGEDVTLSGLIPLDNSKFKRLADMDFTQPKFASYKRIPKEVRSKIWVYDLGEEKIDAGQLLKNGFNWPLQTYPPEVVADGELQRLAQFPNNINAVDYAGMDRETLLVGFEKNDKLPKTQPQIEKWQSARDAGAFKGEQPRKAFFDFADERKTYDEYMQMKGPVFYVTQSPYGEGESKWYDLYSRYMKWAPPYKADVSPTDDTLHPLTDQTKFETDGWLFGYFENDYASDMCRVHSIDSEKQLIHTKLPALQGVQDRRIRLVGINLLCELDTEGEYYIDRHNNANVMYYYPKNGVIDTQAISITGTNKPLMQIEGAREVVVSGLKFTGTTGNGMQLFDTESCNITNCEFTNIAFDAVRIGQNNGCITTDPHYDTYRGGHNNIVTRCKIHNMGGGGVYLAGGVRKTLERGDNLVEYCEINDYSKRRTYTPAVYMEGFGNTMRHNYIYDAPHVAVQIMGNDMLIDKNVFINNTFGVHDMGVIYAGRSWTWLGNVVQNNYIENRNVGGHGIYFDDGMAGVFILNNTFKGIYGNTVFNNCGFAHTIEGNILLNEEHRGSFELDAFSRDSEQIPNGKVHKYRWAASTLTAAKMYLRGRNAPAKNTWNFWT